MQKKLQDLQAKFEELGKAFTDKAAEVLDPAAIQKSLEQAAATAGQAVDAAKEAVSIFIHSRLCGAFLRRLSLTDIILVQFDHY